MQHSSPIVADLVLPGGTRLVEAIGAGGMGEVWRARDPVLHRDIAVKILHPVRPGDDPDATDQFVRSRREARACARVVHPNVVVVHGVGEIAGRPYIAMEWVDGLSLRALIDRVEKPRFDEVRAWTEAICSAVSYAHERGVIHCDLKPENILMHRGVDGTLRPKLVDFGLARGANLIHRRPTQQRGTKAYLAPEAGVVRPTPAVDQFALAMTLAELLAGRRPVKTRGIWKIGRGLMLTDAVAAVLSRGLERRPKDRYRDVLGLREALELAWGGRLAPSTTAATSSIRGFEVGDRVDAGWLAGLPPSQLRHVVLAIVATAPAGFEEAVERIAPVDGLDAVLAELAGQGLVDGGLGGWALCEPSLRDHLLDQIPGPVRRGVAVAVATALAATAGRQDWMRAAAMRLFVAGGDLPSAAQMATDSAEAAVTALQADQRFAEAVALTASPDRRQAWLSTLLARLEWLVDCGWLGTASSVLADALAVASELGLATDHSDAIRVTAADAALRLQHGDPRRAVQRTKLHDALHVELAHGLSGVAADRLFATRVRALAATGALGDADALLARLPGLARRDPPALLLAARARVRQQQGDLRAASADLRRALAGYLDHADTLGAGAAAIELAEVLLASGKPHASVALAEDAEELLDALGPVRWTARLVALRGAQALGRGDAFEAMRLVASALVTARENGTRADEMVMLQELSRCCAAAGDRSGEAGALEELRQLALL